MFKVIGPMSIEMLKLAMDETQPELTLFVVVGKVKEHADNNLIIQVKLKNLY